MSINPVLKYPVVEKEKYVESDANLGILSDYEFLEYDNDSFVLFNPKAKPEHDILSLTNTNSYSEARVHDTDIHGDIHSSYDQEYLTDGELTDDEFTSSHATTSQYHSAQLPYSQSQSHQSKISDKVNQWYMANIRSSYLPSDNIALWNFETRGSPSKFARCFYGDELFQYFQPQDFKKLSQVTKLISNEYLVGSPSSKLNTLISRLMVRESQPNGLVVSPTTETTSNSSLILCGGVGFGDSSSWNDI
jgi:hypothetical protein